MGENVTINSQRSLWRVRVLDLLATAPASYLDVLRRHVTLHLQIVPLLILLRHFVEPLLLFL